MDVLKMAHHSNGSNSTTHHLANPVFHDFLGSKPTHFSGVLAPKTSDVKLPEAPPSSTSVSLGATSGVTRGPISTTSDVGCERHLEGIPFYGPRSDISGSEISHRLVGSKRSNSDCAFMGSSRDSFPQLVSDSLQNSHLMKVQRNEQHGRYSDEEVFRVMQPLKPTSASPMFQHPTGSKINAGNPKWEQSSLLNVSPAMQQPPQGGQYAQFVHQVASNKFRDANAGPSFISQLAADEGSRTGVKGPGILSSVNAAAAVAASEKTPSGFLLSSSRQMSRTNIKEPESSAPPSCHGLISPSRQMTIFYGGQAHVFDDVHPNKADIIMSLAGSNGGSWSTTYLPKSTVKHVSESSSMLNPENETAPPTKMPSSQELHGRLSATANSTHHVEICGDRPSTQAGIGEKQGSILTQDKRSSVQASGRSSEERKVQ